MTIVVDDTLRNELNAMRDRIIDSELTGVELFDAIDALIDHADANVLVAQPVGEIQVADVTIMGRMIDAALVPVAQALTVLLERTADRPRRKTAAPARSAKSPAKSSKTRGKRSARRKA